ncbi:MAG: hypothetical protein LBB83_03945 [Treponema sp.]|jgi:hypothetical protein|nr:hypothetical protein [Treponema sp.]
MAKKNVIAPNDEKALVAMDNQQKAIEKATKLYGDGEPFDVDRILDRMEFKSGQVSKNLYDFGRYCLWLKEAIGWGGFASALESRQFDRRAAYHAMLQVEKFGDNWDTVAQLGSRKARAIAYYTKEEIEEYVKGGELRNIPHDDVSSMLATELEAEVRKQRQKEERLKAAHQKEVEKLNEIIDDLKIRAEDPMQLTPAQRAHQLIRKTYTPEYAVALAGIAAGFRKAMSILADVEMTEGIGVQELNEWLIEFAPDFATIIELKEQWQAGTEHPAPIVDNFDDIIRGRAGV